MLPCQAQNATGQDGQEHILRWCVPYHWENADSGYFNLKGWVLNVIEESVGIRFNLKMQSLLKGQQTELFVNLMVEKATRTTIQRRYPFKFEVPFNLVICSKFQ